MNDTILQSQEDLDTIIRAFGGTGAFFTAGGCGGVAIWPAEPCSFGFSFAALWSRAQGLWVGNLITKSRTDG